MTNRIFPAQLSRLAICKDGKTYNMRSLWVHYYAKHYRFAKGHIANLNNLIRDFGDELEPSDLAKVKDALSILEEDLPNAIQAKYEAHKAFLIRQGVKLNWDSETRDD